MYGRKLSFTAECDTSPNKSFEYDYPHSNVLLLSHLKLEHCKPHKGVHHQMKCDAINDFKLFLTVYRRIYCCKFLKLSNQTPHYKSKCIRIYFCTLFSHYIKVFIVSISLLTEYQINLSRDT